MLLLAPVPAFAEVLRRFFQMELQPVQYANRVEPIPQLAEREPELLLVGYQAHQVIDEELGSERCHPRLPFEVPHFAVTLCVCSRLTCQLRRAARRPDSTKRRASRLSCPPLTHPEEERGVRCHRDRRFGSRHSPTTGPGSARSAPRSHAEAHRAPPRSAPRTDGLCPAARHPHTG